MGLGPTSAPFLLGSLGVKNKNKIKKGWGVMGVFGMRPGPAREIEAMGKGKSGDMAGGGRQGKESDSVCVFGAEGVEKEGIRPCLGGFQDPETRRSCPADLSGIGWMGHKPRPCFGTSLSDLVVGKKHSRLALPLTHQQPRTNP